MKYVKNRKSFFYLIVLSLINLSFINIAFFGMNSNGIGFLEESISSAWSQENRASINTTETTKAIEIGKTIETEQNSLAEKKVIDRFWQILQKNPRPGTAFDRVYDWYAGFGGITELLARCADWERNAPQEANAPLLYGLIANRSHNVEEALSCFERATKLDDQLVLPLRLRGELLMKLGHLEKAAEIFEKTLLLKPEQDDVREIMLFLGRIYERFGNKKASKAIWDRFEKMFPEDLDVKVQIVETLEEEGRHEEALVRYARLAELAKNDNYSRVQYVLAAADIKARLGRKKEAVADFERLLTELVDDGFLAESVRNRIERLFVRTADYSGLAEYYQLSLNSNPNQPETIRRLALVLTRLDRKKEARRILIDSIAKAPSNIPLRLALIELFVESKEYEAAANLYEEIEKIDPKNPDYLVQWGQTVLNDKNRSEEERRTTALSIWHRILTGHEKEPARQVMFADLLSENGMTEEAEQYYRTAVDLAPNDPSWSEYLGQYYYRQGRRDKAIAALSKMATGSNRNPKSLVQLAEIYDSFGFTSESFSVLKEAAEAAPTEFEIQFRYACKLVESALKSSKIDGTASATESEQSDKTFSDSTELVQTSGNAQLILAEKKLALIAELAKEPEQQRKSLKLEIDFYSQHKRLESKTERLEEKVKSASATVWDLWRLAQYYNALFRTEDAIQVLETALVKDPDSVLLCQSALEFYLRYGEEEKAQQFLTRLQKLDPSGRDGYLRQLAILQRDSGKGEEAKKTAQKVMSVGSENPENARFYADILFSLGDFSEGLSALYRSLRLNPTDQSTVLALVNALEKNGQTDEALEQLWHLFDRTQDLESKLEVTNLLAKLYQQSSQIDQLVERLQHGTKEPSKRREKVFCLAQAYISIRNFDLARRALETLLPETDGAKGRDTFLLKQLSQIAQEQGDIDRAIRYQQLLCDSTENREAINRLIDLYYVNGENDRAEKLYLSSLSGSSNFSESIAKVDELLSHCEYTLSEKILDQLDAAFPGTWEVLYRRGELLYWKGKKKEADAAFKRLADMKNEAQKIDFRTSPEFGAKSGIEASSGKRSGKDINNDRSKSGNENEKKNAVTGTLSSLPLNNSVVYSSGSVSPWQLDPEDLLVNQNIDNILSLKNNPRRYNDLLVQLRKFSFLNTESEALLPTLYREKLKLQNGYRQNRSYYFARNSQRIWRGADGQARPLYKPITFEKSRRTANLWRLKIAIDDDRSSNGKSVPPEKAKWIELLGQLRQEYPSNSSNTDILETRLYLEFFARIFFYFENFPERICCKEIGETIALLQQIEIRLAMSDVEQYKTEANIFILEAIKNPVILKNLDVLRANGRLDTILEQFEVPDALLDPTGQTQSASKSQSEQADTAVQSSQAQKLAFLKKIVTERTDQLLCSVNAMKFDGIPLQEKARFFVKNMQARINSPEDRAVKSATLTPIEAVQIVYALRINGCKEEADQLEKLCLDLINRKSEAIGNWLNFPPIKSLSVDSFDFNKYYGPQMRLGDLFESVIDLYPLITNKSEEKTKDSVDPQAETKIKKEILDKMNLLVQEKKTSGKKLSDYQKILTSGIKDLLNQQSLVLKKKFSSLRSKMPNLPPMPTPTIQRGSVASRSMPFATLSFGSGFYQSNLVDPMSFITRKTTQSDSIAEQKNDVGKEFEKTTKKDTGKIAGKDTEKKSENATIETAKENKFVLSRADFKELQVQRDEFISLFREYIQLENRLFARFEQKSQNRKSSRYQSVFSSNNASLFASRQILSYYTIQGLLSSQVDPFMQQTIDSFTILSKETDLFLDLLATSKMESGIKVDEVQSFFCSGLQKEIARQLKESGKEMSAPLRSALELANLNLSVFFKRDKRTSNAYISAEESAALLTLFNKEYAESKTNGSEISPQKQFLRAALYQNRCEYSKAIGCLDAISVKNSSDFRQREALILDLARNDLEGLRPRLDDALKRLSGFQLGENELKKLEQIYTTLNEQEKADEIFKRLLLVSSNSSIQYELLSRLLRNPDYCPDEGLVFALKVFRNYKPSLSGTNGKERICRSCALELLKRYGKLEEVSSQRKKQMEPESGAIDL